MVRHICDEVMEALTEGRLCSLEERGATLATDCVYPSFDQVHVHVIRSGDGFVVTDQGGAVTSAIIHGRDDAAIQACLKAAAARFGIEQSGGLLRAKAPSREWIRSAVMGVANASAFAAQQAVEHLSRAKEVALHEKVYAALTRSVRPSQIKREYAYHGESGRLWRAEYAVLRQGPPVLLKGVVPHYTSIVTAYAGFGDLPRQGGVEAIAVHDQELPADDAALLRSVSSVVALHGLPRFASALN